MSIRLFLRSFIKFENTNTEIRSFQGFQLISEGYAETSWIRSSGRRSTFFHAREYYFKEIQPLTPLAVVSLKDLKLDKSKNNTILSKLKTN